MSYGFTLKELEDGAVAVESVDKNCIHRDILEPGMRMLNLEHANARINVTSMSLDEVNKLSFWQSRVTRRIIWQRI